MLLALEKRNIWPHKKTFLQNFDVVDLHIYSKAAGPELLAGVCERNPQVKHLFGSDRACMHVWWGAQLSSSHGRKPRGYQLLVPAHSIHFVCCVVPFLQKLSSLPWLVGMHTTGCDAYVQFAIGEPKGKRNLIESAQAFSIHTDCP